MPWPNALWSALAFGPLALYCYQYVGRSWLYDFGVTSLLVYAWPAA